MLNVALVGPLYNGLNKYMEPLSSELSKQGIRITRMGFNEICFDIDAIFNQVHSLAKKLKDSHFDIIHYNYGTYDAEQLIPVVYEPSAKQILTVHSINWGLFRKLNKLEYYEQVNRQIERMDGYIYFTQYGKEKLGLKTKAPDQIAWHPATHEKVSLSQFEEDMTLRSLGITTKNNVAILGYASHWKNPIPVLEVSRQLPNITFIFGGPYWSQKIPKEDLQNNVLIIDKELSEHELVTLIENSVGLFPYEEYPSFQGSGLLPNYLARRSPVIVSRCPPLVEYMHGSDYVVDIDDTESLKNTIMDCISGKMQRNPSGDFSYMEHSRRIKKFYMELMEKD